MSEADLRVATVEKVQCNEILDKISSGTVIFKVQVCVTKQKYQGVYWGWGLMDNKFITAGNMAKSLNQPPMQYCSDYPTAKRNNKRSL